jgi:hypothetical protein
MALKSWLNLLFAGVLIVGAKAARAFDENDPLVRGAVADLCRTGKAEGEYDAVLPASMGKVRFYILCLGTAGMVATGYVATSGTFQSMVHVAVDDDTISFLSWDPSSDGAMIAAGHTPSPELHASITALKNGVLSGSYHNQGQARELNILVARNENTTKVPPDILSKKKSDFDYRKVKGRFLLEHPEKLKKLGVSVGFITLNIVAGAQVAHLNGGSGMSALLLSGLPATAANNSGDLFAINSGVDDGIYGASIINHIRGHMTTDDEIEFWFFNTQLGFSGPYLAKRDKTANIIIKNIPATAPILEQNKP